MKISTNLPECISTENIERMSRVISGVMIGYNYSSEKMQRLVEWVGIKLTEETPRSRVSVEIKIKKEVTSRFSQAYLCPSTIFLVEEFDSETEGTVGELFKKTLREMIERLASDLQRTASDLLK